MEAPYQLHSETSRMAAHEIGKCSKTIRAKIYQMFLDNPDGLTDDEIQKAMGLDGSTERPRRVELHKMGLIYDTGYEKLTSSGRMATVWRRTSN